MHLAKFGTSPSNTDSRRLTLLLTKYLTLLMTIMVVTVLWHPEAPLIDPTALNHKTDELKSTYWYWRELETKNNQKNHSTALLKSSLIDGTNLFEISKGFGTEINDDMQAKTKYLFNLCKQKNPFHKCIPFVSRTLSESWKIKHTCMMQIQIRMRKMFDDFSDKDLSFQIGSERQRPSDLWYVWKKLLFCPTMIWWYSKSVTGMINLTYLHVRSAYIWMYVSIINNKPDTFFDQYSKSTWQEYTDHVFCHFLDTPCFGDRTSPGLWIHSWI